MPDLKLGFEVLLQPALFVAAFVWGLLALTNGITKETTEIAGAEVTRRHLTPGTIRKTFMRWVIGGLLAMSLVIVPLGHRAVVWTAWQEGPSVTERARGISFAVPLLQQAHIVNVRAQKLSTVNEEGAANNFVQNSELLQYQLRCTVTWHVEPTRADEMIAEVGPNYKLEYISQHLYDACREGVGDHTALQLAAEIEDVQAAIENILAPELEVHGLIVEGVQLEDVIPPKEFLLAVEAEEVADRNADEAENREREATAKANQVIEAAKGEARAINLRAVAEAQRMERLNMTPTEYIWFTRDNLVLPQIVGDGFDFILPAPGAPQPATDTVPTTTPESE